MAIDESQDVWLVSADPHELSPSAQQIKNYGELVCRCSWIASATIIIMAGIGSAYIDESRLLTFVFFGLAPATIIYMIGFLLRLILLWVGAVYDVINPYVQSGFGVISKVVHTGLRSFCNAAAQLNLYENLILRPTRAAQKTATTAISHCTVDASTIVRLRRLRRDGYRNLVYVSTFPVRQSAQLLIRILEDKRVDPNHHYPAYYPSTELR